MFYDFHQTNSGGNHEIDEARGISVDVIVEADYQDANDRAERIGLYFDGVENGYDCECCGDRWSPQWKTDGDAVPSRYGKSLIEWANEDNYNYTPINWAGEKPGVFIHLKDGRFFGFHLDDNGRYVYRGEQGALPRPLKELMGRA